MRPQMMSFSQVIEQERRRWVLFRRALSNEDEEAVDRMFACVKPQLQAEVEHGRPWRFEAVLMTVLLEHEKRIERILQQLDSEQPWGSH